MTITPIDYIDGELHIEINFWGSKGRFKFTVPDWLRLKMVGA